MLAVAACSGDRSWCGLEREEPEIRRRVSGPFKDDVVVAEDSASIFREFYVASVVTKFCDGE